MRVDQAIIDKIWQRFALESRPIFSLQMENTEFTAIDLYGGIGGHVLRSDGIIAKWDLDGEYEVEVEEGWCIGSLVIASERIPELKEVLPTRPEGAMDCENCSGQGFTDLPNAPRFFLCESCWGLGWV